MAKIYTERQQSESAAANTDGAICKYPVVTEAINANPFARQVEETIQMMIDLILRHDTLLIFPGEDFDQGIILRILKENGNIRVDKDPKWKLNFHRKLMEFAVKNKKN